MTNAAFYSIWLKKIAIAGFVLSIGKNYVHKRWFTINSRCFSSVKRVITEVTYLNVGLLIGQSKSGGFKEELPIWDLYNKVMGGAYNKVEAHKRFLYYHKDKLALASRKGEFNYFFPKVLGGLGLILHPDIATKHTRFQNQLATYLHNNITNVIATPVTDLENHTISLVSSQSSENKQVVPYEGDFTYTYAIENDIPEGYRIVPPKDVGIMTQVVGSETKLRYRSMPTKVFRAFRKSKIYKGSNSFFDLKKATTGQYNYVIVQSLEADTEKVIPNLAHLFVNRILDSVYARLFPNEPQQEGQPLVAGLKA